MRADKQTNRHVHRSTSHPSWGHSNKVISESDTTQSGVVSPWVSLTAWEHDVASNTCCPCYFEYIRPYIVAYYCHYAQYDIIYETGNTWRITNRGHTKQSISMFAKSAPNWLVTIATSLERSQNERQINCPHPYVYQSWIVDRDRWSVFWDNQPDMSIFAIFSQKYKNKQTFLWSYFTVFAHDVATFNALLICPLSFRYSNPFQNGSKAKKILV